MTSTQKAFASGARHWKLTLPDGARSGFSITTAACSGTTATVRYAGAQTGANEYISAVIVDNGSVAYYGRIKSLPVSANASGTVTNHIPAGVTLDTDTVLEVFNEQYNGDRTSFDMMDPSRAYADYASEWKLVTIATATPMPTTAAGIPKTGDDTPLVLLCGLLILSGAGLVAKRALCRRKGKK